MRRLVVVKSSCDYSQSAIPSSKEVFGIADGSRPGRAERAEGQPGRVAAMRNHARGGNGRLAVSGVLYNESSSSNTLCLASLPFAILVVRFVCSRCLFRSGIL